MGDKLPISFKPRLKILQAQFQKRLPNKPSPNIEHRGRQPHTLELALDLAKRILYALCVRDVGADTDGFASVAVDFRDERLVVFGVARKEDDGVGGGEFAGYGRAGAGADAGYDCEGFACCHDCVLDLVETLGLSGGFGGHSGDC